MSATSPEVVYKSGLLAGIVGKLDGNQSWPLTAIPLGPSRFQHLIQNYSEKISFTPVGALVPNRGGTQEQFIVALVYELTIFGKSTQGVLHVENGLLLKLSDIEKQLSVLNDDGGITFQQLQYSQQTNLNFIKEFQSNGGDGLIMWPHVNVNTLV